MSLLVLVLLACLATSAAALLERSADRLRSIGWSLFRVCRP
jgi:hypothetical protein